MMDKKTVKSKIVDFFKKYIWVLICFGLVSGFGWYTGKKNREIRRLTSIVNAGRDSLSIMVTKNGELMASAAAYELDAKRLKEYSEELAKQFTDYKQSAGSKPVTIITAEASAELPAADTIYVLADRTNADLMRRFDFSDKWRTLTGTVRLSNDSLGISVDPQVIHARLTAGIDENNRVFVKTDNPYINVESLEGFTVPKSKTKRWGIGIQAGVGFDLSNIRISPYLGIGISYNLWTF